METANVETAIMESSSMETSSDVDYQPTTTREKCTNRRVIGAFGIFGLLAVGVVYHQFSSTQTEQSSLESADIEDMTMLAKAGKGRPRPRPRPTAKSTTKVDYTSADCAKKCVSQGYKCKACFNRGADHVSITGCASTYGKPSCAMGCLMGAFSTSLSACNSQCDQHSSGCTWNYRGTIMNMCGAGDSCTGEDRAKSTVDQCKVGCKQAWSSASGPRNSAQEVIDEVNKIRKENGKKPATYKASGEAYANKAAAYNAIHGGHKCGIDKVCKNDGWRAAGDFNANDKVDAIDRAYESRYHEGPKADKCDETSHCGALLIYDKIAVGMSEKDAYYVVLYYDK